MRPTFKAEKKAVKRAVHDPANDSATAIKNAMDATPAKALARCKTDRLAPKIFPIKKTNAVGKGESV